MKIQVNATMRRLSDEEMDPMENDDPCIEPYAASQAVFDWSPDMIQDVYKVISERLSGKQREIIEAHLMGYNHKDLQVTEKYWRYHWGQAIKKIKKELSV